MYYKLYGTTVETVSEATACTIYTTPYCGYLGKGKEEFSGVLILVCCVLTTQLQWQLVGINNEKYVFKGLSNLSLFKGGQSR